MAIKKRKPFTGLIVHSDKGSQFRSKIYRDILIKHHFIYSYTELNHSCDQNPSQESFHATLKKECIYNITLYHFEDAYKVIFDYIEGFYNPKRIHSSIGYHSPIEFENFYYNSKKEGNPPLKLVPNIDITPNRSLFSFFYLLSSLVNLILT